MIAVPPESTAQRSRAIASASSGGATQPAEPQRRRERLRRRAEVDDAVGREPLQRPDRRAVVAVLGVVVVLDHDPAPRQQRPPPLGREHRAGRELVRGRDEHRVGVERRPARSPCSSTGSPTTSRPAERIVAHASSSDGSSTATARRPARGQRPARQPQPLRVAAREHRRRSPPAPRTRTRYAVSSAPQLGVAARVAVVERRVRHRPRPPAAAPPTTPAAGTATGPAPSRSGRAAATAAGQTPASDPR